MQVVWARYTFALLLAFIISNPLSRPACCEPRALRSKSCAPRFCSLHHAQFFRAQVPPVDQVLAITFSTPFVVAALSGPTLGEWVWAAPLGRHRVGFIGVLVVTRRDWGSSTGRNPGHSGGIRLRGLFPDDSRPVA